MRARFIGLMLAGVVLSAGCEQVTNASESEAEAEQLPKIVPNLPEVPTLPPPPFPTTYEDDSYSVYGLRTRLMKVLDTELAVTGYIVDIYEPPVCNKRKKDEECPKAAAPHMFIADTPDQTDRSEQLIVVGYADNQEQLERARRGRKTTTIAGAVVVPRDLKVGNKIRAKGQFTLISSGGFNTSNGLLEYASHDTLDKLAAK